MVSTTRLTPSYTCADEPHPHAMSIIVEAAPTLLEVSQLGVEFQTRGGVARVLDDVSFSVHRCFRSTW